jgi:uncharacterized repeat protein (TIGR03837 family)
MQVRSLDIFCEVIDNFGDAGVVYRFAREFKLAHPRCRVRVFIDIIATLQSIVPAIDLHKQVQEYNDIIYIQSQTLSPALVETLGTPDVLIEAFGCTIPDCVISAAARHTRLHINLEYLSAESWVDSYHLKESLMGYPVMKKYFYMPGFTPTTGGILVDTHSEHFRNNLGKNRYDYITEVLKQFKIYVPAPEQCMFGSLFTYTRNFDALLHECSSIEKDVYILVFGEKSKAGMQQSSLFIQSEKLSANAFRYNRVHILFMPFLPQQLYDELLCTMDFNIVRGEDSLVRAIQARKPFIWNAYLQEKKYQHVKVAALLALFAEYCLDKSVYTDYCRLMTDFNDNEHEDASKPTPETYTSFFADMPYIEKCTARFGDYLVNNCNLIQKISAFLADY